MSFGEQQEQYRSSGKPGLSVAPSKQTSLDGTGFLVLGRKPPHKGFGCGPAVRLQVPSRSRADPAVTQYR